MRTRKPINLLLITLLFIATSCGKKKWDKTTTVSVKFEVVNFDNGTPGLPGTVEFNAGQLHAKEIRLVGDRKQSDDINIVGNGEVNFNLVSGVSGDQYNFDIPQGTYTDFRVELSLKENGSSPAIKVMGSYTNLNSVTATVQFVTESGDLYDILAKENDGTNEIVLVEGSARSLLVQFDVNDWFSVIAQNDWENADHVNTNQNSPIFINDQDNVNLYNLILAQIANSLGARFE
jgi:hypothetical protein